MSHVMWDVHWTGLTHAEKKIIDHRISIFQKPKLHKTFLKKKAKKCVSRIYIYAKRTFGVLFKMMRFGTVYKAF